MKKLFVFISVLILSLSLCLTPVLVRAESEETPSAEVESKDIEDIVYELADKYLGKYIDKQLLANILTIIFGLSGYLGLFLTSGKYRKYKKGTDIVVEDAIKRETSSAITGLFNKLSEEKLEKLTKQFEEIKKANDTIMKVLVLMQDSSPKGKVALIDYLGDKTDNDEIKKAVEETTETLEKAIELKEEITEAVKTEYEEIF